MTDRDTQATEDVAPMSMDEGVILLGAFSEYIKSKYIMCSDDLRRDMRDAFIAGAEWQRKYGG